MAKSYTSVTEFPSRSRPGKVYTVKCESAGELTCDCPAWVFKKNGQERTCTHVRQVMQRMRDRLLGGAPRR